MRKAFFRFLPFFVLISIILVSTTLCTKGFDLYMIDVGMAECIVLATGNEAIVVDAAYARNADSLSNALDFLKIDSIKYLVLTHPHADHIGGAKKLIETHSIDTVLLPPVEYSTKTYNSTMEALQDKNINMVYPQVGDEFHLGNAALTVYGPHPVAYENMNDWSLVFMLEYAGRRILFTGDAEESAETDMLYYSDSLPLQADILKVAHHGSCTSSSYPFVEAVSPKYAIISCGDEDIEYPHIETAMTLIDCGVEDILTTNQNGDIHIRINPFGKISVL